MDMVVSPPEKEENPKEDTVANDNSAEKDTMSNDNSTEGKRS